MFHSRLRHALFALALRFFAVQVKQEAEASKERPGREDEASSMIL